MSDTGTGSSTGRMSGATVREARQSDAVAMATAFITSYRAAHRDHVPPEVLVALSYE